MMQGLMAAFRNETVKGRTIEVVFENDNYEPELTLAATRKLIERGVFAMVGNVGTPTAEVCLPVLRKQGIPAVGFFTGASLLRPGEGHIINFRASYIQETARVIKAAVAKGLDVSNIFAYVQNDAYGMAGLEGIVLAFRELNAPSELIEALDRIIALPGDQPKRNNLGPVGVYQRNKTRVIDGYNSLIEWEKKQNVTCKMVVTVGAYANIAQFANYARKQGKTWMISAVSFTGADDYHDKLRRYNATDGILMTQVVPLPSSQLEIVGEARDKLGDRFGIISLEGYIVGRMALEILRRIPGELTRDSFVKQARRSKFNLGGVAIDLTRNGHQASDLVEITYLDADGFKPINDRVWERLIKSQG